MKRSDLRSWSGFLLGLVLLPAQLRADAIPPPPAKCPAGQLPISSHRGPECVLPPPKDCPPGWSPQLRGICTLATCQADKDCGEGQQCRETDLCLQEFIREWSFTQYEPRYDRPLFAGPPMKLDPPRHEILPVDVCGNGRSCVAPATCGKGKLCLPRGVNRPGIWSPPAPTGKAATKPTK